MQKLNYEPPRAPRFDSLPPLKATRPTTTAELRALVTEASPGARLRPVGGGRHIRQLPTEPSHVIDLRGLSGVLEWDARAKVVHVEAGITVRKLTDALSRREASLASWRREHPTSTVGGLLAAYQPVPRALWNGSIREACLGLTCVTPTGAEYGYVPAPRKAAGPDLRYLFIGAEGRYGAIAEAWLGVAPAPETAKFYAIELASAEAAMDFVAVSWATGVRVPNALYSGATRSLWLLLEGSRDFVNTMEGILLDIAQAASASLRPTDPENFYDPSEGDLRAGADPAAARPEDARGGVAIWGNLRELGRLPDDVWKHGVAYDIAAHQASVWIPETSAADIGLFEGFDLSSQRTFWYDGKALEGTRPAPTAVEDAIARSMDPNSTFAPGGAP